MISATIKRFLLILLAGTAWAAPFTNGGFESGWSGWNLVGTDWNCIANNQSPATLIGCPTGPDLPTFDPALYVLSGNQGAFLGYGDGSTPATLTQTVTMSRVNYRFGFYYLEHNSWPDAPDFSLEVVFGSDLANLTSVWQTTSVPANQMDTWIYQRVTIRPPAAGDYVVGFRFYNVWGEWAVDDTTLVRNPEPGSLILVAAPLALAFWKLRRKACLTSSRPASAP